MAESRDERGQVLVLVLAMLVIVAIFVGALAELGTPIFTHATVVRNLNDTVAAADSGIDYAVQTLQGNPAPCLVTTETAVTGAPPVNGRAPTVTCLTVTPPSITPVPGISYVLLKSTVQPSSGKAVVVRAVVQVNDTTGSATIESWRTCQDPPC